MTGTEESAPVQLQSNLPLVSLLIRSADRSFLAQALDSVALQTYPNIEVVVLAVRPNHRALGDYCGRFPIRLIPTDQPVMRSAAANAAIAAARGEFLIFLDDDDWMMPDHVARLADVLVKLPETQAVYTGIGLVDATGQPMGQAFDLPFDPLRQLAGNMTPIHAVLFRAKVISLGCHFDESLDRLEDWDFWLQVAKLAPMVHLPGISAVYRIHESSGVHNDAGTYGAATHRIYQKWESDWTPQQISQIMQRVWAYPDMENRLIDALKQLSLTEQRMAANQAIMAEQMACMAQQAATIAQQASAAAQHAMALAHQQRQIAALTQHGDSIAAALAHSERERFAITNSSIWRVTQPLRKIGTQLKSNPLSGLRAKVSGVGAIPRAKTSLAQTPQPPMEYREWVKTHDTVSEKEAAQYRQRMSEWRHTPLISIVMPVYNPPLDVLEAAIVSVQAQIYPHWELCIADDASPEAGVWELLQKLAGADQRIKLVRRSANGHISLASNSAVELATGEFLALMDNDDLLPPDALYWVAETVNRFPAAKVIYSDEDRLDEKGERYGAYFKPDWNYTLFMGHNMISHLGVYHTQLVRDVGGFRQGLEGSQDYDLALRCIERIDPADIIHIPRVLYHWRAASGSTALTIDAKSYALDAAQRALQEHLVRVGSSARVEQLPSLDCKCIRSTEGVKQGLTVVLVHPEGHPQNGAAPAWTLDPAYAVSEVLNCDSQGASINAAVAAAKGPLVALVGAHLRPQEPAALLDLAGHALEAGMGAAAGTVRDTAGMLAAGGLVLNPTTIASVLHRHLPAGSHGYAGRGSLPQELSALNLDCIVFRKEVFTLHGGLDPDLGMDTLGAVAWSLRLRDDGYKLVWYPGANWNALIEPSAQLPADAELKRKLFVERYGERSAKWLDRDPAYHPRLDPVAADFSLLT